MAGPRRTLVATALLLGLVAGACGGDDSADMPPPTTTSAAEAPTTTSTEAPSTTTTTEPGPGDVVEVPVADELLPAIPDFGTEALVSTDPRFDVRRCDGTPFQVLPAAQAEAVFSKPAEELTVGVYLVPDGIGVYFYDDYLDSLLTCSGGNVTDDAGVGEVSDVVPYDSATSNGTFTLVLSGDLVWVVQKRTPSGPAELTDAQLATLYEETG